MIIGYISWRHCFEDCTFSGVRVNNPLQALSGDARVGFEYSSTDIARRQLHHWPLQDLSSDDRFPNSRTEEYKKIDFLAAESSTLKGKKEKNVSIDKATKYTVYSH